MNSILSESQQKAIRLVEYLTRLASLRTKLVRDVAEYIQTLWIHEIPEDKECFTQAWGPDEEYDHDIWIEVRNRHEPELPNVPDICRNWADKNNIRKTSDLPGLLSTITIQVENPARKEGEEQPQFISHIEQLDNHPEVQEAWSRYVEQQWMPWAEEHEKWEKIHRAYSTLFTIHQEQLRLGEEYELVLGVGLLTWQTPSGQRVRRHLVVANAMLEFEARLGRFTVRPNSGGIDLRPELDMLDIEEQPTRAEEAAKKTLKGAADNPWDKNCVEGVLKALIHSINPNGEYHKGLQSKNPRYLTKPIVEYAPTLILRKRSIRGLTETLKRIKHNIQNKKHIPPEFGDLAEIQKEDRSTLTNSQDEPAVQLDGEIYFPKPSNEEQRRIVQKMQAASGVLVQGPPGTGKSHTIANLICHLLATGQRTLITAKTPRALQVLERLLPEELRPLCINLLGSGLEERRSLEASVRAVLRKNENWNEARAQNEMRHLKKSLYSLRKEKATIDNRLRAIRESETYTQTVSDGAYRGTVAQIAQAVKSDETIYGWFTDKVRHEETCPLKEEEILRVLYVLRSLTPKKKDELGLVWPKDILSTQQFEHLIARERKAEEQAKNTANNIDDDLLKYLLPLHEDTVRSVQDIHSKLLNEVQRLSSMPYAWIQEAIRDVSSGKTEVWQELHKASKQTIANIAKIIQETDSTEIVLPKDCDPKVVFEDTLALKDHLSSGGKLGWGPFCPKIVKLTKYIIKTIYVNGHICDNLERVATLASYLSVRLELEHIWSFLDKRFEQIEGPYILQFRSLETQTNVLGEALSLSNMIKHCKRVLMQCGNVPEPYWHEEAWLRTFVQTCAHAIAKISKRKATREIQQVESPVATLATRADAHPVTKKILQSIRSRKIDAFAGAQAKIEKLDKEKKIACWADEFLQRLSQVAPKLAQSIKKDYANTPWDEQLRQISKAWRWAQARSWLQEYIRKDDVPSLAQRTQQIEDDIGNIIAKIASLRAWSFCFSRMQEDHRRNMEAWQLSMRRLGKGTGKHAPRHRRAAQKHLNQCRDAVPAWVMPLHRVWDTVDPAPGIFDVIIVDEASQCGFDALPLQYLGKKVLIVGDDKQISPDAVGISRDAVHRLMEEYLHDFKFKSSFDVESSLFDHGKLRYGTRQIALQEHFRCMPEIIRFSNDLCYSDTPLITLRQYGPDRFPPLKHVFLQDGYREGSGNRVINRPEADRIVEKIVELCEDERYTDKTMGVVILQGDGQARLIETHLLSRLGAEEMERRRLICGNPYSFQGDERDIMFISMVAAANERIGPFVKYSDERRFNVAASRARDQMWLFHSVTRDDLSSTCLRRQLLEFFEETRVQSIAGIDLNELQREAEQANRSIVKPPNPFDSWFEVDVALEIARKNYNVIPQFEVAGKRIDLVVEGGQARLAVECDGDEFHGADQYDQDTQRQRMLERCGWVFFRIRAGEFYTDRKNSLKYLWPMLEERGIFPQSHQADPSEEYDSDPPEPKMDQQANGQNEEYVESKETEITNADSVQIGDTVVFVKEENPDSELQALITRDRSNPEWGTINVNTPIAQALLGASIGDVVEAILPMGMKRLHIKEIRKEVP